MAIKIETRANGSRRVKVQGFEKTLTEQHHAKMCDINNIIKKYGKDMVMQNVDIMDGELNNITGLDYKTAMDIVANAQSGFEAMPSEIRNKFDNDPSKLLDFVQNPANVEEARNLGLVAPAPLPDRIDKDGNPVPREPEVPEEPVNP